MAYVMARDIVFWTFACVSWEGFDVYSLSSLLCEEMKREKLSALPTNIDIQYYGMDVPTLIEF